MTKTFLSSLLLVLLLLFVSCGGNNDTDAANKSEGKPVQENVSNDDQTYTASTTPAPGWEAFDDNYTLFRYRLPDVNGEFWCRKPAPFATVAQSIERYKENENKSGYTMNWGDVKDVKVGNYDAKLLEYNVLIPSGAPHQSKLMYNVYFITQGNSLFHVVCLANSEEDFNKLRPDFDKMLSAFTIKAQ